MTDPRERVAVGRARVSRLGFGTAPLGGLLRATSEADAIDAVHAALEAGLCYFDTAPQYGGGLAERRLGRALQPVHRDDVVISSKVGKVITLTPGVSSTAGGFVGAPSHAIAYDYSHDGTLRSIESSLERLGTTRLDIVLIHDVNRKYHGDGVMARLDEALDGACRALRSLREQRVIGAFGPALNEVDISLRFVEDGDVDCIMLPQRHTLLDRTAEPVLLGKCLERGVRVLAAGPFDSGILATGAVAGATYNYQPASPAILARVGAIEAVCREFGITLRAAALQFPLRHPAVASVVTGMRHRSEVADNLAAITEPIPERFWTEVERVLVP
jgi:D-threo-aldose 1-dehydrogenase